MLCGRLQSLRRRRARHRLRAGIVDVAIAGRGNDGPFVHETLRAAAIDRQHVVLAGLDVPRGDHFDQFVAMLTRDVVVFSEVFVDMVEFPPRRVELR